MVKQKSVSSTCASTGGIHGPTMSEHLLITPSEITKAFHDAADALARHPVGRFGAPEDIANLVAVLASDQSTHVSVVCLTVDGAMAAAPPLTPGMF